MMSQTINQQRTPFSSDTNTPPSFGVVAWLHRFYATYQARRDDRMMIRQIERLDDIILGDVTGLTRAQLDVALRLPAAVARREIARQMRAK